MGNVNSGIFSEANRPFLFLVAGAVTVGFIIVSIIIYFMAPNNDADVSIKGTPSGVDSTVYAEQSEAYKAKRREKDVELLEGAQIEDGVHIPFTFNEEKNEVAEEVVSACGCLFDDEKLVEALNRLGYQNNSTNQLVRIADSDIYVKDNKQLFGDNQQPLFYKQSPIISNSKGTLLDENGIAITLKGGSKLHITTEGDIVNDALIRVSLNGDILMSDGVIILSNGLKATRPGNLIRKGASDIYLTIDAQLSTLDGRPILHSGEFVFSTDDGSLIDKYQKTIIWESSNSYISERGHLTNNKNLIFNTPGLLFSWKGILIDNYGKLTQPLEDLKSLGNSDLYVNDENFLRDANSMAVTHYGYNVRIGAGGSLITSIGDTVVSRKGASVFVNDDGLLSSDINIGLPQSGILKSGALISIDRQGKLISRKGKLSRTGESDVYTTIDGLLSDELGLSIQYQKTDMFLDHSLRTEKGDIGLETVYFKPVIDFKNERVYLSTTGEFVNAKGELSVVGTDMTNANGVVIASTGKKSSGFDEREIVLGPDGTPIYYNGKQVFKGPDNKLYDADGNLITTKDGLPIIMNENGEITDINGMVMDLNEFTDSEGEKISIYSDLKTELLDEFGKSLLINGRKVYRNSNGELTYANGELVKDEYGGGYKISPNGELIDSKGGVTKFLLGETFGKKGKFTSKKNNTNGFTKKGNILVSNDGFLLGNDGKAIKYNGKSVRLDEQGRMVDENGNLIKDINGNYVYMNDKGEFVDDQGNVSVGIGLTNGDGVAINSRGLPVVSTMGRIADSQVFVSPDGGFLLSENGEPLLYNGKKVRLGTNGEVLDEDGNPILDEDGNRVFINNDGTFTNRDGKKSNISFSTAEGVAYGSSGKKLLTNATKVPGTSLLISEDNTLLRPNGEVLSDGRRTIKLINGELVDSRGRPIRYKGRSVGMNSEGELIGPNGELLLNDKGEAITLSDLTEQKEAKISIIRPLPLSVEETKIDDVDDSKTSKSNSTEDIDSSSSVEQESENNTQALIDSSGVSNRAVARLNARYQEKEASLLAIYNDVKTAVRKKTVSISNAIPLPVYLAKKEGDISTSENTSTSDIEIQESKDEPYVFAGESFMAVINMAVNTDYNNKVSADILGVHKSHIFYQAEAFATVELRYDNAVLNFNRICGKKIPQFCTTISAIGLDPATLSAGVGVDIDEHFWYRYGGLFLASFVQGVGEAAALSAERTEEASVSGSTTVTSGLDGDKLLLAAGGTVGETFVPLLANRYSRPATVTMPVGSQLAIKVMNNVTK